MTTYSLYECADEGHLMVSPATEQYTGPCPYCGHRLCSRIGEVTLSPGWDTEAASSFTTFGEEASEPAEAVSWDELDEIVGLLGETSDKARLMTGTEQDEDEAITTLRDLQAAHARTIAALATADGDDALAAMMRAAADALAE